MARIEMAAAINTLGELNDDCLEYIFQRLDLQAQFQVSHVCHRFKNIIFNRISRLWKFDKKYRTLSLYNWQCARPVKENLRKYLVLMREHFKAVVIDYPINEFLADLDAYELKQLPKVERLDVNEDVDDSSEYYHQVLDDQIDRLVSLMPNLKYLRLPLIISGKHIAKFTDLQELHLYSFEVTKKGNDMKDEYFAKICENLTQLRVLDVRAYKYSDLEPMSIECCTNLEVLKLNLNTLLPVLQQVLQLPRLKHLTVNMDWYHVLEEIPNSMVRGAHPIVMANFLEIVKTQCGRITGLAFDNECMRLPTNWDIELLRHRKLRNFSCFGCGNANSEMLAKYARSSPQLQTLFLHHWMLTNADILFFVNDCPLLEHITFIHCDGVTETLLHDILDIQRKRSYSGPIRPINIYAWPLEEEKAKFWRDQRNFMSISDSAYIAHTPYNGFTHNQYQFDFE